MFKSLGEFCCLLCSRLDEMASLFCFALCCFVFENLIGNSAVSACTSCQRGARQYC